MNLVEQLKGQIGGDTLSRLAGAIGAGTNETRGAVDAAIPAMLAGLTHVASTPEGARKLDDAVETVGDNPAAVNADGGGGILHSLMGGGLLSGLSGALSKFTGLGGGSISSLLAMCGPMILGFLKRQKTSLGLDAGGVANLLSSQKQNIAAAMPAGLGSMLGSVPGLGALSGMLGGAKDASGRAVGATERAVGSAGSAVRGAANSITPPRANIMPWAIGAAAVLILGFIVWKATHSTPSPTPAPTASNTPAAPNPPPSLSDAIPAAAQLPAANVTELSTKLTDTMKSATDTFTSITDSASADTALPKLQDISKNLGSMQDQVTALPATAKTQIQSTLKPLFEKLDPLMDKAAALPGVGDKINPLITDIRTKLKALTGQ
jgi:hypothetical protein